MQRANSEPFGVDNGVRDPERTPRKETSEFITSVLSREHSLDRMGRRTPIVEPSPSPDESSRVLVSLWQQTIEKARRSSSVPVQSAVDLELELEETSSDGLCLSLSSPWFVWV